MKTDTRACIYARVSTSDGRQDFSRQIIELKKIIKEHGYLESQIDVFAEMVSGYRKEDERPELNKLMKIIRDSPKYYSCVYTSEISRLGRDPRKTREIIDELTDLGVPIYIQSLRKFTIDENGSRDIAMNIHLQVLIEYYNFESETFKTRSKSGLLKSAKEGKVGGGNFIPYGYKKGEFNKLVVDNEESKIIKKIFQLYSEGYGIKVISNILNDESIPTRTNKLFGERIINFKIPKKGNRVKWSDKQIHDILRNPIYKGCRRFKNETIDSPKIVTEELFELCNDLLKNKKTKNIVSSYNYLLKEIAKCGICGRNYFGRFKPTLSGDKVYKCSSTLIKGGGCGNRGVNIKLLESTLFHMITENEQSLKLISNVDEIKIELEKEINKLRNTLSRDSKLLKENSDKKERLLHVHLNGDISYEVFQKQYKNIENEIYNIESKLNLIQKQLEIKQKSLKGLNKPTTTKKTIIAAKNDRHKLEKLFKQLFHRVTIVNEDNKYIKLLIFLKVKDMVVDKPLKILLDSSSLRKSEKVFRYKYEFDTEYSPILYGENHLIQDNFLNPQNTDLGSIKFVDWIKIDESFLLEMS
jgi:site-specific DNA recombinase